MTDPVAGATDSPAAALHHASLPDDEVGRIHDAALELLASRGVQVDGEIALGLLRAAGASVESSTGRVRLPAALVARAYAELAAG